LRAKYPDLPPSIEQEVERRLRKRWYTEEAWETVVKWIEATPWFARRMTS
jgi:hypothetical protein